ncbi:MAG: UDP-N-acetylmuramoyl-tripeptide--D-alanyl-D-alanine ligase [Bacteroidales bacterium]|nr:UDP-N-acetylmuramoyl-tripeptide--D-alanyl-D-alanine ligase [Bacteroidales bacterium]
MPHTLQEIYNIYLDHPEIVTDSRKIKPGCLFVALKGESFNGNEFAEIAVRNGAAFAIIDEPEYQFERCILVDDSLKCLQQLALHHRNTWNIPVIGITGTNGKTTTKEIIRTVLGAQFRVHATEGNFNNHIGVPLTILSKPADAEIAIIEMGANHQGEIAFLSGLAFPTHGIITNIGKAHLEGFGGYQGVVRTKNELYRYIREKKGIAFVNGNDELLCSLSEGMNTFLYGTEPEFSTTGEMISSDPYLLLTYLSGYNKTSIHTQLVGAYNFSNVLAALCIGKYFGVPENKMKEAIEAYKPTNNRSQTVRTSRNEVIMDAYNANPSSMQAALRNFAGMKAEPKMAILGDMLELGDESQEEHIAIIRLLKELGFVHVVLVGPEFVKANGDFTVFPDSEAAKLWIAERKPEGFTILIKGSRGIRMEKILEVL